MTALIDNDEFVESIKSALSRVQTGERDGKVIIVRQRGTLRTRDCAVHDFHTGPSWRRQSAQTCGRNVEGCLPYAGHNSQTLARTVRLSNRPPLGSPGEQRRGRLHSAQRGRAVRLRRTPGGAVRSEQRAPPGALADDRTVERGEPGPRGRRQTVGHQSSLSARLQFQTRRADDHAQRVAQRSSGTAGWPKEGLFVGRRWRWWPTLDSGHLFVVGFVFVRQRAVVALVVERGTRAAHAVDHRPQFRPSAGRQRQRGRSRSDRLHQAAHLGRVDQVRREISQRRSSARQARRFEQSRLFDADVRRSDSRPGQVESVVHVAVRVGGPRCPISTTLFPSLAHIFHPFARRRAQRYSAVGSVDHVTIV
ncbi:putative FtsQ protein [Trichinella spiralis]|uniref:putative FtsQ protein n=1 Tax=Trichinella spiralis TaxID=6334 RepID=UPI0001EFBC76|nr:putative FtsQ protein [Trichinella spiralis]